MAQGRLDAVPLDYLVSEISASRRGGTRKDAFHSVEGDCVSLYIEDAPHLRTRVDDLLTVFHALDDGRFVGLQIKNVSAQHCDAVDIQLLQHRGEIEAVQLLFLTAERARASRGGLFGREFDQYLEAFGALGRGHPVRIPAFVDDEKDALPTG